jgi:hypothetical protein
MENQHSYTMHIDVLVEVNKAVGNPSEDKRNAGISFIHCLSVGNDCIPIIIARLRRWAEEHEECRKDIRNFANWLENMQLCTFGNKIVDNCHFEVVLPPQN